MIAALVLGLLASDVQLKDKHPVTCDLIELNTYAQPVDPRDASKGMETHWRQVIYWRWNEDEGMFEAMQFRVFDKDDHHIHRIGGRWYDLGAAVTVSSPCFIETIGDDPEMADRKRRKLTGASSLLFKERQ